MASNYIDFSDSGQYATASLYRPPKYMRVGNSIVRSPTEFNLSDLYSPKNMYSPLPQALSKPSQVAPVIPNQPQEAIGVTNVPNVENYIQQGGWQKWNTIQGNKVWMPTQRADGTPVQDGDIYTTVDGGKYRWDVNLNTWLKLTRKVDADTGIVKWIIDPEMQPFIGTSRLGDKAGQAVSYESLGKLPEDINTYQGQIDTYSEQLPGYQEQYNKVVSQTVQNVLNAAGYGFWTSDYFNKNYSNTPIGRDIRYVINALNNLIRNGNYDRKTLAKGIKSIFDKKGFRASSYYLAGKILENKETLSSIKDAVDKTQTALLEAKESLAEAQDTKSNLIEGAIGGQDLTNVVNWQPQLEDTIDKFRRGEIEPDIEQLKNGSWAEQWLGNVMEQAQKTGLLVNPFLDNEGNPSQELQNIMDAYNENIANQHIRTMKNLRLAAIQRGHSPNDVYYNEALSNWQAGASMQIASNISDLLVGEMKDSYEFISNALADALRASNRATEADMLQQQMSNQWAQALDDYKMKIESLAQEMADTEAARQGQIITSIVGLITSILGAVL